MFPIFDGHNDVLLRLAKKSEPDGGLASFVNGDGLGHLDLPRARAGGFAGGLFAVFVPSNEPEGALEELMRAPQYDAPLPVPTELTYAQAYALNLIALLMRIARESNGAVRVCHDAIGLRQAIKDGALAAVLHTEGAEPIDIEFKMLEVLYAAGLRSLGIVWSRPNLFGHGVPFRFPSLPDTGPGLTDAGKALVKACNELGILVDLSHITEAGFWNVASLSEAPLVASHSNAHALCPHSRNLTDKQLAAIRESGGMVGINFATCFLRDDGRINADTPMEAIVRHADYLIDKLGVEGVGLGSDFDGAVIPKEMESAAGLPRLIEAFRSVGYDEATLRKLCTENWLRVLERTWTSKA
jgi:membrane dipeptidase